MRRLNQQSFEKARSCVFTQGRELDRYLFSYYFEDGQASDVITALGHYQNDDGGFGRALEPDLRAEASSAIATQRGFDILREIGTGADEPIVKRAVSYLLDTFDEESLTWPIIPPDVEDAPHAPWWTYADSAEAFGDFLVNPRAALIGHLHAYNSLVPYDFLVGLTSDLLTLLENRPGDKIEMHDLDCYLTLANSLHGSQRETILAEINRALPVSVEMNPENWSGYNLKPLAVVPEPGSPLTQAIDPQVIEANLDYEIDQQLEDGSWPLSWSWEFVDAAAWAQAARDWKGHIAVKMLKTLHAYGRIG